MPVPTHARQGRLSFELYVAMLAYLALTLACLGYIDQGRSRMNDAVSEARRLGHAHTLAHVLIFASRFDWLTASPIQHLDEVLTLTAEHGFRYYLGWAQALRGQSLVAAGQLQDGLTLLRQGLAELRAAGGVVSTSMLLMWMAEAHALLEQPAEERNCFNEAAGIVETTEERFLEAELLHRVRGDLLNAAGDRSAAEQAYRQAIVIAERQSAKLLQVRASISLARLWHEQDKCAEASNLLTPIYNWFAEGFDAADLKAAKALLDDLA